MTLESLSSLVALAAVTFVALAYSAIEEMDFLVEIIYHQSKFKMLRVYRGLCNRDAVKFMSVVQ